MLLRDFQPGIGAARHAYRSAQRQAQKSAISKLAPGPAAATRHMLARLAQAE